MRVNGSTPVWQQMGRGGFDSPRGTKKAVVAPITKRHHRGVTLQCRYRVGQDCLGCHFGAHVKQFDDQLFDQVRIHINR